MISWPFMMVVQVHHPWWESIVVVQFLPATYLPVIRLWFILKRTFIFAIIMDSKWNTIQQVSKSHQFKTTLTTYHIDKFWEYSSFPGIFILCKKSYQNCQNERIFSMTFKCGYYLKQEFYHQLINLDIKWHFFTH